MDEIETRIARTLASRALQNMPSNYPWLAINVGWYNDTGQGLGKPLTAILRFCHERGLPALTSIVCKTGTRSPSHGGMDYIRDVIGPFELKPTQDAVFAFDWRTVPELGLAMPSQGVNYQRLYATRSDGFGPNNWGMLGFGKKGYRDRVLALMNGSPICVVHFCSPSDRKNEAGVSAIGPENLGRLLGIAEILPVEVSSQTHVDPKLRESLTSFWGSDKWPFGLAMGRAWEIVDKPFARDALPDHYNASWDATNSIVALSDREKADLTQYSLKRVEVYGQAPLSSTYVAPDPAVFTYMAVCWDTVSVEHNIGPPDHHLVKIGVTNELDRRLLELNGNHLAVIFGITFKRIAYGHWINQAKSLEVEARAHAWCHKNGKHASGEYFYLTEDQIGKAAQIVKIGS